MTTEISTGYAIHGSFRPPSTKIVARGDTVGLERPTVPKTR